MKITRKTAIYHNASYSDAKSFTVTKPVLKHAGIQGGYFSATPQPFS